MSFRLQVSGIAVDVLVHDRALGAAIAARFTGTQGGFTEMLPERRALRVQVDDGVATLEYAGERGYVELDGARVHAARSLVLTDALVRIAVAWHLAKRGAMLLHASAIRGRRGAVVFFGASQAGKSSLARAFGDPIADELVHVERTSSGWRIHPTPWWNGAGDAAPLDRLVWVVRGESPSIRSVRGAELLRALFRESGRYVPDHRFQASLFELCVDVARGGALRVAAAEGRVVEDVSAALANTTKGEEAA